jgi:hypothetical protein
MGVVNDDGHGLRTGLLHFHEALDQCICERVQNRGGEPSFLLLLRFFTVLVIGRLGSIGRLVPITITTTATTVGITRDS